MFSQAVIESLAYYVYLLKDPLDGEVFYVGKGCGNRIFEHIEAALTTEVPNDKLDRIRSIKGRGDEVVQYILRHGLDEATAFEIEAALIDFIGLDQLCNLQSGHHSEDHGIKTVGEIVAMYEADGLIVNDPVILINVNRLYKRSMTPKALYDATRQYWVVGNRREKALYAIATYRGLTREVYKINDWFSASVNGKIRWGFNGEIAVETKRSHYRYKSITSIFMKGSANPIKYINC